MEASLYLLPSMRISASAQKNPRDWNQFDRLYHTVIHNRLRAHTDFLHFQGNGNNFQLGQAD